MCDSRLADHVRTWHIGVAAQWKPACWLPLVIFLFVRPVERLVNLEPLTAVIVLLDTMNKAE